MENYSSPVYQLITDLVARMLNQKPELYHSIQAENPENEVVRENFMESAEEIRDIIGDPEEFSSRVQEMRKEFSLEDAQNRTDKVVEQMTEEVR